MIQSPASAPVWNHAQADALRAARRALLRCARLGIPADHVARNLLSTDAGPYLHSEPIAGLSSEQARLLAEGLLAWSARCGRGAR